MTMMKHYDESVKISNYSNWTYIPDHPYRILIIGGSGSGKNSVLLYLIKHQDIDQILTNFIYTSKIHSNQSINCLLMEEKK